MACTCYTNAKQTPSATKSEVSDLHHPCERIQRHRDRSGQHESRLQAQHWWLDGTRHADPSVMLHPGPLFTSTPSKGFHPATAPTSWQRSAFTRTPNFPNTLKTPAYKPSPPSAEKPEPSTHVLGTRSVPQLSAGWSSLCSSLTDEMFC